MVVKRKRTPRESASNVTLRDVAEQSGVSLPVASLILANKTSKSVRYSEETRARVQRIAHETGYRPNRSFTNLMQKRHGAIGILLTNMFHLHSATLESITQLAKEAGQLVVVEHALHDDAGMPIVLAQHSVDGILAAGTIPTVWEEEILRLDIPTIWVNANRTTGSHVVAFDEPGGMEQVCQHLKDCGCRRWLFAHPDDEHYSAACRLDHVRRFCEAQGLPAPLLAPRQVRHESDWGRQMQAWGVWLAAILGDGPTVDAVIVKDELIPALYRAAKDTGRAVPHDLAVVGIGNGVYARAVDPRLTAIGVDHFEVGRAAARSLFALLAGEAVERTLIPYRLEVRESTKRKMP